MVDRHRRDLRRGLPLRSPPLLPVGRLCSRISSARLTWRMHGRTLQGGMEDQSGSLFSSGPDWRLNACVNYAFDDLYAYAEGYRRAGDMLAEQLIADPTHGLDFVVYPLVFLYRHAIELQLKGVIRDGRRLLRLRAVPRKKLENHELDKLWELARPILEGVWPEGDTRCLDRIDAVVRELTEADPSSQAFRYDRDTHGNRTKPKLTHVNVEQFRRVARHTYDLLDGATTGLCALLDAPNG